MGSDDKTREHQPMTEEQQLKRALVAGRRMATQRVPTAPMYVVTAGTYEDWAVIGVYSDAEIADSLVSKMRGTGFGSDDLAITPYPINSPNPDDLRYGFAVLCNRDGSGLAVYPDVEIEWERRLPIIYGGAGPDYEGYQIMVLLETNDRKEAQRQASAAFERASRHGLLPPTGEDHVPGAPGVTIDRADEEEPPSP